MKKTALSVLIPTLLPLALTSYPTVSQASVSTNKIEVTSPQLELSVNKTQAIQELVIIDAAVNDKHVFYQQKRPDMAIVELDAELSGQEQLNQILKEYKNLSALHIISHADDANIQLGNSTLNQSTLQQDTKTFAALNGALREGGDVMLYGCDLAQTSKGEELLELITVNTHADVAASSDKTGNPEQHADWELEVQKGNIETQVLADSVAVKDFSDVLAQSTVTFDNWTLSTNGEQAQFSVEGMGNCRLDSYAGFAGARGARTDGHVLLPSFASLYCDQSPFDVTSLEASTVSGQETLQLSGNPSRNDSAQVDTNIQSIVLNWAGLTRLNLNGDIKVESISFAVPPTAQDISLIIKTGEVATLSTESLNFSALGGNELDHIKITEINVGSDIVGWLDNDGDDAFDPTSSDVALALNAQVSKADIDAGKLKIMKVGGEQPAIHTIKFKVNDGEDDSVEYTLTIEPAVPVGNFHEAIFAEGVPTFLPQTMIVPPAPDLIPTYILKSLPSHGTLGNGPESVFVGGTFDPVATTYQPTGATPPIEDSFTFTVQYSDENVSEEQTVTLYTPQPQEGLAKTVIYTDYAQQTHVALTLSPDGTKAYGIKQNGDVINYDRNAFNNTLTMVETLSGSGEGFGAVISDDGNTLYVSEAKRLAVYQKNDQGRLTLAQSFGEFDSNQVTVSESVYTSRLGGGVISLDGRSFYLVGVGENAPITYFDRDTTTGLLTLDNTKKINTSLKAAWSLKFSPDGKYLYVMDADTKSRDRGEGGIAIYSRDSATGELTEVSTVTNITDPHGNPRKLAGVIDMLISADGKTAYTLDIRFAYNDRPSSCPVKTPSNSCPDLDDGSILIFDRNVDTGELSFRRSFDTRHLGFNEKSLQRLAFSPDESKIYATTDHNRVSDVLIFDRNTTTGELRKSIDIVNKGSYVLREDDVYGNEAHSNGRVAGVAVTSKGDLYLTDAYRLSLFEIEPRVSAIASTAGTYEAGDTVTITIEFNRTVEVTGTPQLQLSNGAIASYSSGSDSNTLTFTYTVAVDDNVGVLNQSSVNGLILNSGTIKDEKGADAVLSLPVPNSDDALSGSDAIINNLPTAQDIDLVSQIDEVITITEEQIGFTDSDEGQTLDHITLKDSPYRFSMWVDADDNGELNGTETTLNYNAEVSVADIQAGKLKVKEASRSSRYLNRVNFTVNDGLSDSTSSYTLTLEPKVSMKGEYELPVGDSLILPSALHEKNHGKYSGLTASYTITSIPQNGTLVNTAPPPPPPPPGSSEPAYDPNIAVGDTVNALTNLRYQFNEDSAEQEDSFTFTVQYSEENVSEQQTVSLYKVLPQEGLAKSLVNTDVDGITTLAISSDGEWAYGIAYDNVTLTTFKRDPFTGELTVLETLVDEGADSFGNTLPEGVLGDNTHSVVVSPDGNTIYVTAEQITVFQKDAETGRLRLAQSFGYYHEDGGTNVLVDNYEDYSAFLITPDERFVYVGVYDDAKILRFSRDPSTGLLSNPVLTDTEQDYNWTMTLSPDGRYLYSMEYDNEYIFIYQRDEATGDLTKVGVIEDLYDSQGNYTDLDAPWDMLITQDGLKAYVSDVDADTIFIFDRNNDDGSLTFLKAAYIGDQDIDYDNYNVQRMFFNADESIIYLATDDDDYHKVLSFERNKETGDLRLLKELAQDGQDAYEQDLKHLSGAISLALAPEEKGGFYVMGEEGITLFDTQARVLNVTSDKADATYAVGEAIAITIQFNRVVEVEGTPQLTLNSGAVVDYSSGSGTDILTFNYTVGATDSATDLNYASVDALSLNGGSIKDIKALDVAIVLPPLDHEKSLGENKALVINVLPQANNSSVTLAEDGSKTITLDASDAETANLTYTLKTQPSNGTLSAISNGEVTYTPNANWHGSDSFSFSVTDEQGAESGTATVSITVNSVNDEPVISSTAVTDTAQYANYSYTFAASDVDTGSTLTITSTTTLPSWLTLTNNGDGTATLIGTPDQAAVGTHNISLQVSDGEADVAQNFTINVANVNDAPVIGSTATTNVEQDKAYIYTLMVSDLDNDSLTLSIEDKPDWLTFDAATGILSGTPTQNEVGDHAIKLRVSDGIETIEQNYTLNVIDVNDAPEITSTAVENVNEDEAYQYIINTNDIDPDASLTITAEGLPEWLTLTDQGNGSATLSGTPTQDDVAETEVTIQVSDGELSDTQTFTLAVKAVNDSPEFATDTQSFDIAENGETAIATIAATDVDNETLSYSLSGEDASVFEVDEANGALSFKTVPDFDAPTDANADNTYHVTVKAEDADGASAEQAITVNVTDVALAVGQTDIVLTIPTSTTKDSVIGDLGLTGDALQSLQITQNSSDVITVSQQGVISVVVDNLTAGTHTLTVEVSDGTTPITVSIAVHILGAIEETTQDKDANNDGINDHLAASFGTEDTDKDGIPDALERLISDDLSTVTATSDADQDGMPDVAEIMVGRDPKVDDQATAGAPSITVTQAALALASTGVQSSYTQATLGVSVSDTNLTAVAYFKTDSCKDNLPYNYKTVCKAVPETGFTSGQHDIWWVTEDSKGNWAVAEQSLTILPAIAFASDLILAGQSGTGTLTTQLSLNGPVATDQDFTVPFTVSGTAQTGSDYTLSATEFTFKAGELDSQPITITMGNNPTSGNELILTLNESATVIASAQGSIDKNTQFVVLGEKPTQAITVVKDTTYAPMLSSLTGTQAKGTDNEVSGLFFEKSNGAVTLSFSSYDPDGGAYSYDWSQSDADIVANLSASTVQAPELNTAALEPKSYRIEVSVTDSTTSQPAATLSAVLNIFDNLPLSNGDQDGDGIPDSEEGLKDSDGDGLMDYLDAFDNVANSLPTNSGSSQNHLVTVDTGLRIKLGETAQFARTGDAQVDLSDLEQFGDKGNAASNTDEVQAEELAAVFDYEVENLSVPADLKQGGLTANIVLPLSQPLTETSDFLKYNATDGWAKFIIDDNNKLAWAGWKDGIEGQCPLSNSDAYSSDESLKAGKHCLRVTLQDGGANDADKTVNGRIVDPLAVSKQAKTFEETFTVENTSGGGSSSFWALLFLAFGAAARKLGRRQH